MKPLQTGLLAGTVLVAVAATGGYWLGQRGQTPAPTAASAPAPAGGATAPKQERKLLYYRNPMGLPDTSPTPKKDSMGMDYIAVYEGEDDAPPGGTPHISISTEKVQKLGVRTEAASLRTLSGHVRAAGRVEPDERRLYTIAPKYEGYIERLLVSTTGQPVSRGQALFEVYSPELVSAQREYAIAAQGLQTLKDAPEQAQGSMRQLAESSLTRLKNWDISDEQIRRLNSSGQTQRTLTFRSPVSGIVTEKKALQGMRFMPGDMLYQVADLSSVWVLADVFEQDLAQVRLGARATVHVDAYADKTFTGKVSYIYPNLKPETRTVAVRVELANPGGWLKPGMFAQVELSTPTQDKLLTVPDTAVIDSGTRSVVLVQTGPGRFEPRTVTTGRRAAGWVHIREGVRDGEQVVVAANFLLDAESNLKAALQGLGTAPAPTAPASTASAPAASAGYRAQGKVESLDAKAGTVTLTHGPVPALKWPGMTMDFKLANHALQRDLSPGRSVAFEFVERAPGEWVITAVTAAH